MDVGSPSNFVRVLEIFDNEFLELKEVMEAVSVSDETTMATMREVFDASGYIFDPHGAVGYRALADRLMDKGEGCGFFFETAHPVKFDSVTQVLGMSARCRRQLPSRPEKSAGWRWMLTITTCGICW